MNQEAFITWALDAARTIEERFTVEILVENVMDFWHLKHKTGYYEGYEPRMERDRQRYFNPAYVPTYSETDLRYAAEVWPERKFWWAPLPHEKRPIRDISALRFLTHLEAIKIHGSEISDPSVFAELPNLKLLEFASKTCEDFRPLARCTQLRSLTLSLQTPWPDLTGLEQLAQLETFILTGNLLALRPGLVWPHVRHGGLNCSPQAVRSVRDLPAFPACEILQLGGVDRLDGIEAFPQLRNLNLTGVVRDFTPLTVLAQLTCFTYAGAEPLDMAPLTRLPKLLFASFSSKHNYNVDKARPRDYMPLLDAPQLRELQVTGCPPVAMEVANLNKLFPVWDDLFLVSQPAPLLPFRFIVAPTQKHPRFEDIALEPEDHGFADTGLRGCEGRWVAKFIERTVTARLGGHPEWGNVTADGIRRCFHANVTCFALVEKLPVMLEAMREVISRLRPKYSGVFMVNLKAPPIEPTPEQIALEEHFQAKRDEEEYERYHREHKEFLERLYRYDLKKQVGDKIKPEDFAVPPIRPLEPEIEEEENFDDDGEPGEGGVAVKEKPDPPKFEMDDEHPLADEYMMIGHVTLTEVWVISYARDIAAYLLGRQPDEEIPADAK